MTWGTRVLCALSISSSLVSAQSLQHADLQKQMEDVTRGFDGRIGVCVQDSSRFSCVNGDERFPLQSVMKLLVAIAVMDAVDRGEWRLTDPVVVRKHDLSLAVQPLAQLVTENGFNTTIDDLVAGRLWIATAPPPTSWSPGLAGRGPSRLVLERHHVTDVRFDRDERHLQTEIAVWNGVRIRGRRGARSRIRGRSGRKRDAAFRAYQRPARHSDAAWHDQASAITRREPAAFRIVYEAPAGDHDPDGYVSRSPEGGCFTGLDSGAQNRYSGTWRGVTAVTNDVGISDGARSKGDQSGGVHRRFAGGSCRSRGTDGQHCADDHQDYR